MKTQVREYYSMDYTTRYQVATKDGITFFKRYQTRNRFGLVWTKWTAATKEHFEDAKIDVDYFIPRLPKIN